MLQKTQLLDLEIISETPKRQPRQTTLLFVHGAFVAAWCWSEHFLPYFARHGYRAYAVSLRGHGGSCGFEDLPLASLDDYVEDIAHAISGIEPAPVLVGHSMGGMLVQRFLEAGKTSAAVLMAPVPSHGLWGAVMGMAIYDPGLFQEINRIQYMDPRFVTLHGARKALFSSDTSDAFVARHLVRMQPESKRAIYDMSWPRLILGKKQGRAPVLVLGAEDDAFFPPHVIESTAKAYGVEPVIFPGMAHAMMLEPRWQAVADHILDWLESQGL